MKWVSFWHQEKLLSGYLDKQTIHAVSTCLLQHRLGDLDMSAQTSEETIALAQVTLCQPIYRPGKILGIGVNYHAHMAESVSFIENKSPSVQKWFNKQNSAANGPYDTVHVPKVSDQLDYEAELVVIIGRRGRHVPEARAMEMVAGFACGCDYSVRDWQRASATMIMGKGFDTHAVFGPYLVTPDETGAYEDLSIRGYVNGTLRQEGQARDMRFSVAAQIAHLTQMCTLEPGDVIFTGTPAGVGAGFSPPEWLKAGDRVRVEIAGLGYIENAIIDEPSETMRLE